MAFSLFTLPKAWKPKAQCELLEAHGCHAYPGYLFSRPLPIEDLALLLPDSAG
jgi:EAL domain-containing protein (putative c-di-GMP-specific phosphodiesterase class I)